MVRPARFRMRDDLPRKASPIFDRNAGVTPEDIDVEKAFRPLRAIALVSSSDRTLWLTAAVWPTPAPAGVACDAPAFASAAASPCTCRRAADSIAAGNGFNLPCTPPRVVVVPVAPPVLDFGVDTVVDGAAGGWDDDGMGVFAAAGGAAAAARLAPELFGAGVAGEGGDETPLLDLTGATTQPSGGSQVVTPVMELR